MSNSHPPIWWGDVKLILQYQDYKVQRLGFPRKTPLKREQTKKARKENFFSSMKSYLHLIRDILIWGMSNIYGWMSNWHHPIWRGDVNLTSPHMMGGCQFDIPPPPYEGGMSIWHPPILWWDVKIDIHPYDTGCQIYTPIARITRSKDLFST